MKTYLISSATIGLIIGMSTSAMAACKVAPESTGNWKKDAIVDAHYIMNDGDKCFLNLRNSEPSFKVTGIYLEKDAKHGEVHEFFESPHDGGNALTYVPKPGFKGEETLMVTFETEYGGKPSFPRRAKWKITVE